MPPTLNGALGLVALAVTGTANLIWADGLLVALGAGATAVAVTLTVLWRTDRKSDREDEPDW